MDNARILVTGITGIHGWPIFTRLQSGFPHDRLMGIRAPKAKAPTGPGIIAACITDISTLIDIRNTFHPTHVIHCAGVCDLDVCEERPHWASALNTEGTRLIAEVFGAQSYILFTSTDLVFSGSTPPENGYTEECTPDPINVVGKTFAAAEHYIRQCPRHCIIRLGLPLGRSITGDKGALDWIGTRLSKEKPVTLFTDEFRSCIPTANIAEIIEIAMRHEWEGLYHLGGDEKRSLFDIGEFVRKNGAFRETLLKGILREEEIDGPPRVGNVALDSKKMRTHIQSIRR